MLEVLDKGKAAAVTTIIETRDKHSGELIFENQSTVFIRGAGGFGGKRAGSGQCFTLYIDARLKFTSQTRLISRTRCCFRCQQATGSRTRCSARRADKHVASGAVPVGLLILSPPWPLTNAGTV